ncbi:MAG: DUF998 domain-containing protein [Flavobacteriales bacterium]|nr:MAG: DUF998 domain-containing protein [Flavobacteriales bacterium]
MATEEKHQRLTHSYLALRKTVGLIGMLLPFALLVGMFLINLLIDGHDGVMVHYPESISHYYYSILRGVFVGALCAVALFMFFYCGYDKSDNITGNLAGLFALGVAWFPTSEGNDIGWCGIVHYTSAALFFGCLAYFSIKLFTKSKKGDLPTLEKLKRNKIYKACGWFMVFCLVAMATYSFVIEKHYHIHYFIWAGEALALLAFGISWLTKGGTIYKDR